MSNQKRLLRDLEQSVEAASRMLNNMVALERVEIHTLYNLRLQLLQGAMAAAELVGYHQGVNDARKECIQLCRSTYPELRGCEEILLPAFDGGNDVATAIERLPKPEIIK